MNKQDKMPQWMRSALVGLALAGATSLCLASPPALTNNFNSPDDFFGWSANYAEGAAGTVAYNPTGGVDGSGCVQVNFGTGGTKIGPLWQLGPAYTFRTVDYVRIDYDMLIDAASGTDGNGTYGNWQEILRDAGWSWDAHWVGALSTATAGSWVHRSFAVPNNAKTYPMLAFELMAAAGSYSADVIFYLDNIVITPFYNPLVIGAFADASELDNWSSAERASVSFSTKDAENSATSGSLKVNLDYDPNITGWQQGYALCSKPFTPNQYTFLAFDVFVENPNNATSFGLMNVFARDWVFLGGVTLRATNVGQWTHYEVPIPTSASNAASGLRLQFGVSSGSVGAAQPLALYLDNIQVYKPIVQPALGLRQAGPGGVQITMDNNSSQWQREALCTPADATTAGVFWVSQGSYPVTYSFTITNFPDIAKHSGFEAHLYVVNRDTIGEAAGWNETYGGADWNAADILEFRVENGDEGGVIARIDWKTNLPGANPLEDAIYHPVYVEGPTAIGTWSLTFTNATDAIVTGPGITATNFSLPEDAVWNNFNPTTSFLQFGVAKNDGENDGHNNGASGTFSHVAFTGSSFPIDDDFSGATLTNKYAWRVTRASSITYVPQGTAWWLNWSLPADGYTVESAPTVAGPWDNASVTNTYQLEATMYGAVPAAALPAGNATFFRLVKPESP